MSSITIKASLNDEMRRLTVCNGTELTQLRAILAARFEIPDAFALKWIDEDGDAVTIANHDDLTEALATSGGKLRLLLSTHTTTLPAPATPPAPAAANAANQPLPCNALKGLLGGLMANLATELPKIAATAKDAAEKAQKAAKEAGDKASQASQAHPGKTVHLGVTCDVTGQSPIVGTRYHKKNEDYDLCEDAFQKLSEEEKAAYEALDRPSMVGFNLGALPGGLPAGLPAGFPGGLPAGFPAGLPAGFPAGLPLVSLLEWTASCRTVSCRMASRLCMRPR